MTVNRGLTFATSHVPYVLGSPESAGLRTFLDASASATSSEGGFTLA